MYTTRITNRQLVLLVILRVLIGWHLLYEGMVKLLNPDWTSAGFLHASQGIFSPLFVYLASDPQILLVIDFLNKWALTLIGLFLILGLFTHLSAYIGAGLLLLYYLAMPPFAGLQYTIPMEGSYLIVNKTLIEATALLLIGLIDNGKYVGLDRLVHKIRE